MASDLDVIWDSAPLGDCATWLSGGTPSTSEPEYWNGDIPWITASSLKDFFIRDSKRRVTELGVMNGTRLVPRNTTIVVVRGMSLRREWRVGITTRAMSFGQDCKALVPDDRFDPLFFAYATKAASQRVLRLVERAGHGTGRLSTGALKAVEIPLPPMPEQRAIARALRTVQRAKEATEQVIAAARELKRSLLGQLLDGRWSQRPIGEVCETATGGTPNRKVSEYFGGGIPWVKSGEVVDGRIKYTSEMLTPTGLESCNARVFPGGTLLIAMYGAGVTAGRVGLLEIDAATNQAVCAILPDQAEADSRFLFHVLIHLRSAVRSARHGSNQPNLSQRIIRGFPVPLPPLDEQHRIVEKAEAIDRKIMAEEARRDALATMFDSFLHDLMTARLPVNDLEVPA